MNAGMMVGALCLIVIFVWMLYMMTCRTGDWIALTKADEERRRKKSERLGRAAKGAFGIARFFMKR